MRLTIEDALKILDFAAEGRTNSVKPDLLANELNRRIERIVESEKRLERAEALRETAEKQCPWCARGIPFRKDSMIHMDPAGWECCRSIAILALIPSTAESALDKLLAEARLKWREELYAEILHLGCEPMGRIGMLRALREHAAAQPEGKEG
jgi:hypothetical protein